MLQTLWQKISGKQPRAAALPAVSQSQVKSATSRSFPALHSVNNPPPSLPDQYLPLWRLQAKRQIIEVKVGDSGRSFQTMVMAIDIQRGILWLDDLFPTHHTLEVGDSITLIHHHKGEMLSFTSPLVAWGRDYGASGLAIILPEQVRYLPRRQFSRCDLSKKAPIVVKIRPIGHDASYGTLQDLSVGGLRLSVAGNLLAQLAHGALLPVCELTLSEELHICCSARIRAFRMERGAHRCTQISVEFIDMPFEKQKQLQYFINNLQHLQRIGQENQSEPMRQSA
ncbi:MAG TPA: PilZ domain-containing protein [Cellvibrio sp.]|nr:PilZ domain-containing protein [Cellvibrio sp.]